MLREKVILADCWRFQPDPEDCGEAYGYPRADYEASQWREVRVPCSLERGHPDLEWYVGVGWYRRAFYVPEAWRGKRVVVRFEGVNYHAKVWVNGQLVGRNEDGFLPFEIPIQDVVRYGHENVLVVKADNLAQAGEVPGANVGWRPYGGILREVTLNATERCYVSEVRVVAEPHAGGEGTFSFRTLVKNEGHVDVSALLSVAVIDAEGKAAGTLISATVEIPAGAADVLEVTGSLEKVAAWSPDDPVLYTARASLRSGSAEIDGLDTRFGFRRIETDGTKLLLNREPIYLVGFNRHEDSPHTGMCADLETVRRDLLDMKAMGCNFVRLCHYPHHPGELDLCDELGLLAMDEIPVYGSTGMAEDEGQWRNKVENARRQLATLIVRDWNHPSLIFWSVSNETREEHTVVVEGNDELIRYARELDPSRLVVHVSFRWDARRDCEGRFDHDDVICVNGYPWMRDLGLTEEGRLVELTQYWGENLARLREAYPNKPILVAEFGYRSMEGVFDNLAGEDVHARVLAAQFAGMDAPCVCGATIWCYADHAWPMSIRLGSTRSMTISPYGVVTRRRKHKAAVCNAVKYMFKKRGPAHE
jgi:beta-galactosidase/beta-glucuronidase